MQPLAGLKQSVVLEQSSAGTRLVDRDGGASLPVSELEAALLRAWDGRCSAVELAARVFGQGVDVEAPQVETFFQRLARVGVLHSAPPAVPVGFVPPSPGVDAEDDVVPRLRGDLLLKKPVGSRGVMQVTDPLTERTFTLYDFEVSIARMLDGRSTVRELVAGANALGVPATVKTLQAFLRQLRAWRFVEQAPSTDLKTTWPDRRPWTDDVRELYVQASRLARQERTHDALSCLESLLELDPANEEGLALKARLLAAEKGERQLEVPFDVLHTSSPVESTHPAVAPELVLAEGNDPFDQFDPVTDPGRQVAQLGTGPTLWPAGEAGGEVEPAAVPAVATTSPPSEDEEPLPSVKRSKRGLAFAAVAVLTMGVGLMWPVRTTRTLPCAVTEQRLGEVLAPFDGRVTFEVADGASVTVDQGVARAEHPDAQSRVDGLEQQLATFGAERSKLKPASGAKVARARQQVKAAQGQVDALRKARAKLAAQTSAAATKKVAALDKSLRVKAASLEKAKAALEALTREEALALLAQREAVAKGSLAEFKAQLAPTIVKSPAAGVFRREAEGVVSQGARLGHVSASTLRVTGLEGAGPGPFTVRVDGSPLQVSAAFEVTAPTAFVGKACVAELEGPLTPWVLVAFGSRSE